MIFSQVSNSSNHPLDSIRKFIVRLFIRLHTEDKNRQKEFRFYLSMRSFCLTRTSFSCWPVRVVDSRWRPLRMTSPTTRWCVSSSAMYSELSSNCFLATLRLHETLGMALSLSSASRSHSSTSSCKWQKVS
jgi:hypothetical protein